MPVQHEEGALGVELAWQNRYFWRRLMPNTTSRPYVCVCITFTEIVLL